MSEFTKEQVKEIVAEAQAEARKAAEHFFQTKLGGRDQYACGFAWVNIYGVKGSTKLGKALIAAGFSKSYTGGLQLWNPSKMGVQNVDTLEAGADAAAKVLKERLGLDKVYAGSRLD
jgi:hypothetical protein